VIQAFKLAWPGYQGQGQVVADRDVAYGYGFHRLARYLFAQDRNRQADHQIDAAKHQKCQNGVFKGARIGRLVRRYRAHAKRQITNLAVGLDPCGFKLLQRLAEHQLSCCHIGLGNDQFALGLGKGIGTIVAFGQAGAHVADQFGKAFNRLFRDFDLGGVGARIVQKFRQFQPAVFQFQLKRVDLLHLPGKFAFGTDDAAPFLKRQNPAVSLGQFVFRRFIAFAGALHLIFAQALGQIIDLFLG
jgi:hypothetical protein